MATTALRTALVYDFDGTLAPGNIQEHSLIPDYLGMTKAEFWAIVGREKQEHDADEILVYLRLLIQRARELSVPLTRAILQEQGARTPLFQGVKEWFGRINAHAAERGLLLEHHNSWDHDPVNRWMPPAERPVPFSRIIYLGDGDTDIPSMKMVRHQGGHSVAVFDPIEWENRSLQGKVYNLIAEDRATFVVPADYRDGSQLDITIKGILGRIARDQAGYREDRSAIA